MRDFNGLSLFLALYQRFCEFAQIIYAMCGYMLYKGTPNNGAFGVLRGLAKRLMIRNSKPNNLWVGELQVGNPFKIIGLFVSKTTLASGGAGTTHHIDKSI